MFFSRPKCISLEKTENEGERKRKTLFASNGWEKAKSKKRKLSPFHNFDYRPGKKNIFYKSYHPT